MIEREGAAGSTATLESAAAPADESSPAEGESLVEMVLSEHAEQQAASRASARIDGIVVGVLAGLDADGQPLVDFSPNPRGEPLPARSTVAVDEATVGRDVALMFEGGDPGKPIMIGVIHRPEPPPVHDEASSAGPMSPVEVEADGEKVVVSAQRELVLRCGKASITLTSAGKILIRGAYVLTRSSGVNRIQGGSVQIN
jgi:hypothetical protein